MFDLPAGTIDRPFQDKHLVPTLFSIVTHLVIVGAVIGAALFWMTGGLPEVPSMIAFVADMPAPPPPPPPPPPPAAAPKPTPATPPSKPVPSTAQLSFPVQAPTEIRPESGIDFGEEEGLPGGVEGGIPGGVAGGVVGGIITDVPAPPPQPKALPPVRIGGQIQPPTLIRRVEPVYPDIAVQAHVTGVVILEATVNERGEVINVAVLRSIKLLDQAAIDAVKQWRYSPVLLNGVPRSFVLTVTLNFSIT
jgi:protein TonB